MLDDGFLRAAKLRVAEHALQDFARAVGGGAVEAAFTGRAVQAAHRSGEPTSPGDASSSARQDNRSAYAVRLIRLTWSVAPIRNSTNTTPTAPCTRGSSGPVVNGALGGNRDEVSVMPGIQWKKKVSE